MNSTKAQPHAESTRLTLVEWLSMIALGLGIAGVCAVIAFAPGRAPVASAPKAIPVQPPRQLAAFMLTDRTGRTVTDAELAGKFLVVNFVFTSCSLSCRAANDRMAEVQRLTAHQPDVWLVSFSVDPGTDTPPVLTKFADSFGADPARWLFLTGEPREMYRLLETSFIARSPELSGLVPGGFAHTDNLMLVDPRGQVWASFNGLKTNVAAAVVAEIERRREAGTRK